MRTWSKRCGTQFQDAPRRHRGRTMRQVVVREVIITEYDRIPMTAGSATSTFDVALCRLPLVPHDPAEPSAPACCQLHLGRHRLNAGIR